MELFGSVINRVKSMLIKSVFLFIHIDLHEIRCGVHLVYICGIAGSDREKYAELVRTNYPPSEWPHSPTESGD